MNELMMFMFWALFVFIFAWIVQIGSHPSSARATFAAIMMTVSVMIIIGSVALTLLNLIIRALGA